MAAISFTREMRLNQKETKELFRILERKNENQYVVKTPPAEQASSETAEKLFRKTAENSATG